jgi:hypothetical protein
MQDDKKHEWEQQLADRAVLMLDDLDTDRVLDNLDRLRILNAAAIAILNRFEDEQTRSRALFMATHVLHRRVSFPTLGDPD